MIFVDGGYIFIPYHSGQLLLRQGDHSTRATLEQAADSPFLWISRSENKPLKIFSPMFQTNPTPGAAPVDFMAMPATQPGEFEEIMSKEATCAQLKFQTKEGELPLPPIIVIIQCSVLMADWSQPSKYGTEPSTRNSRRQAAKGISNTDRGTRRCNG
ncbi:hypothetical protein MMC25_000916 [Agyrium rufum]|nr:hypothetical protein [Agyrium rufum]